MRATDYQGSFLGRISIRRNQVLSMVDGNSEQGLHDLELFQMHVADGFADLLSSFSKDVGVSGDASLLSMAWLRKLLDVFLHYEAEFKDMLITTLRDPSQISKHPLDRLIPEHLDRLVKSLDICNVVTMGLESVRHYKNLADIVVSALASEQKPTLGYGQVRRAKKALSSLITAMTLEDRDGSCTKSTDRTWSFGIRSGSGAAANRDHSSGQLRSQSCSMPKNWSATKQILAMSSNLTPMRSLESFNSLALQIHMMSTITVFVMWALVAAIPCLEKSGLGSPFQISRQSSWAQSMIALQDKIVEEWKKKERKGSTGLLDEMQKLEKLSQSLLEFTDSFQFPAESGRLEEMKSEVRELAETCRQIEEGLLPLQLQIRRVFHRIVRSRTEIMGLFDQTGKLSPSQIL